MQGAPAITTMEVPHQGLHMHKITVGLLGDITLVDLGDFVHLLWYIKGTVPRDF